MKKWQGSTPTTCQTCGGKFGRCFFDALVPILGRWGLICFNCFVKYGCKLGTGFGQKYNSKTLEKEGG